MDFGTRPATEASAGYAALFERAERLAHVGAFECDLETEQLTWTPGVYDLFGLPRGSLLMRSAAVDLYEPESRERLERLRADAVRAGGQFTMEAQIHTPAGEQRWVRITAAVDRTPGRAARLYGMKQDITRERAAWERLRRLAESDMLTGLANRGMFQERFFACDGLGEAPVAALLLVDLDHFKLVNDRLGHPAGDECLRVTAIRLRQCFPDASLIARIGGDEFAVLLAGAIDAAGLGARLAQAERVLRQAVFWEDTQIAASASIGAAIAGTDARADPQRLFAEADYALYAAKAAGRGGSCLFGTQPTGAAMVQAMPLPRMPAARFG